MVAYAYKEEVPCHYTTSKDLEDRLGGTIIRYKGLPRYVMVKGHEPPRLCLYDPREVQKSGMIQETISPDDPDLDISGIEAMYVNFIPEKRYILQGVVHPNMAMYISRDPMKQWKQGLSTHCKSTTIDGKDSQWGMQYLLYSDGLYNSLLGKYPSYHQVLRDFDKMEPGEGAEFAISPDVALRRSEVGVIFIFYRRSMVGWIAPGSDEVNVVNTEMKWVIDRYLARLKIIKK